jgi:signal transduction histidine kinase/DNA-binding NarL/FixJ family response regulator
MPNKSILIVEDEGIVAEDLANKVQYLGYEVVGAAATGEEAVKLARRHRPALVLMDIRLAGAMDGIEAARQIHREHNLPVLFLTAHSDKEMFERAQRSGAYGYILKPFDERELRIQIEMALYKHSIDQQLRVSKEQLVGINQILQAALTCETEEELGFACLDIAEKITRSQFGFISDINKNGLEDIAISNSGWEACKIIDPRGHRLPLRGFKIHGIHRRVIMDGQSLFTNDPANHPDSIGLPDKHPPLTSFLGVPLKRDGSVIGLLAVGNRQGGYTLTEQELLEALTPSIVEAFLRKRTEEALKVLNQELELRVEQRTVELQETQKQYLHMEKLSAIGRLSASIAHEFNNPLQGILSVMRGLKKRAILEEEDQMLLAEAIQEGNRVKELIRNLQEFNRPTSGRKTTVDLHKSIESVLLLQKSKLRGKRVLVVRNFAERLPQIHGVPDQIKQVFLNLLTNAADACRLSGGVVTVSTWQEDEERVAVAIHDTGRGIEPSNLQLIFQPFYTTKSEVKGTGLGLSVSFGIVKHHQGEIRVDSQPGEGTTFTVLLPIKSDDAFS